MIGCDVAVIGGGIAGASVACFAARQGLSVVLLEREDSLSAHSTGRSAASLDPTIGPAAIRALTRASTPYLLDAVDEAGTPVLRQRSLLMVACGGAEQRLMDMAEPVLAQWPGAGVLDGAQAVAECPVLRLDAISCALLVPDAYDIDVEPLFRNFLSSAKQFGARTHRGFGIESIRRQGSNWVLNGPEVVTAPFVVNAAGAWADDVAQMAGVEPVGLQPLRRTAFAVEVPADSSRWPLVADIDESFYFKPWGASQLLVSAADETPDIPGDAKAQSIDVARCIDAVAAMTTLSIRHVRSAWAGHRTFTRDRVAVVGFDPEAAGFFWCAGLGGTGIQNSPAIGELAGALLAGVSLPAETAPLVDQLSPRRIRTSRDDF